MKITSPKVTYKVNTKKADTTLAPLLDRISRESKIEFTEMQNAFKLLGWGSLPDQLKIEIYADVRGMVEELKGFYSSACPYHQRRKESVHFWVSSFVDGICNLDTAVNALKVKSI